MLLLCVTPPTLRYGGLLWSHNDVDRLVVMQVSRNLDLINLLITRHSLLTRMLVIKTPGRESLVSRSQDHRTLTSLLPAL